MKSNQVVVVAVSAVLLGALPLVAAHGMGGMEMGGMPEGSINASASETPMNYFRYPDHSGWMVAHIVLMTIAWIIVMPAALMLSVARSRYHLPAQVVFHILNGVAVFAGFVYNHSTPDLYEKNAHHPIGWVLTCVAVGWTVMSCFVTYSDFKSKTGASRHDVTTESLEQHNNFGLYVDSPASRYSRDSGHGTERNSSSLLGSRQNSSDSVFQKPGEIGIPEEDHNDGDDEPEKSGLLGHNRVDRFLSRHVRRWATPRASSIVRFCQIITEKLLLLLAFAAYTTGFVTYGGLFRGHEIFGGLAHFIKGGIFFWYGLLTLGRWMGAFTEFGWAWNQRPLPPMISRWKARVPSAEFTESFVIWLYGATNVFMEHLGGWGQAWLPSDFEHLSITVLFFGGGILGMLVESPWARDLMNTTTLVQRDQVVAGSEVEVEQGEGSAASRFHASNAAAEQPTGQHSVLLRHAAVSLNPIPGMVIMLLGLMMSAHHQDSMVSTMMHAQWGSLFVGFAMARGVTYVMMYIKPPTTYFPSRPPSELIAAFCLTAGGMMFMFSAHDTVVAVEQNGLDAMTIFTVTMGLAGLVLAWEIVVFSLKGWAVRKERSIAGKPLATYP